MKSKFLRSIKVRQLLSYLFIFFSFTDYLNDNIASLNVFKKAPSLETFKFGLKNVLMLSYVGNVGRGGEGWMIFYLSNFVLCNIYCYYIFTLAYGSVLFGVFTLLKIILFTGLFYQYFNFLFVPLNYE